MQQELEQQQQQKCERRARFSIAFHRHGRNLGRGPPGKQLLLPCRHRALSCAPARLVPTRLPAPARARAARAHVPASYCTAPQESDHRPTLICHNRMHGQSHAAAKGLAIGPETAGTSSEERRAHEVCGGPRFTMTHKSLSE